MGTLTAGCFNFLQDDKNFPDGTGGGTGTGGDGGNGGTTTNTGGAGGATTTSTTTTTVPVECVPANVATAVNDECGVFVSSSLGDDANEGNQAKPFATIAAALQKAPGKTIYLCNETFTGEVGITGSANIYGGLDCTAEWVYGGDTARSTITAETDLIPVRLRNGGTLTAFNLKALAVDATKRGGSSIAILAEAGTKLDLTRSDAEAGNGAAGEDPPGFPEAAASGEKGPDGLTACSAAQVITPEAPANQCGVEVSSGGLGGLGQTIQGGPGGPGAPILVDNSGGGEIGNNPCGHGADSEPAANGAAGAGAKSGLGTLNAELGFIGPAGGDGQPGKVGQGGGGGGGAKGGTAANQCSAAPNTGGASGGAGGSGGCGGLGGKGGGGGGSSIAIVSLGATVLLTDVTLTASNAGRGGNGGGGQDGGQGGPGGAAGTKGSASALKDACHGGKGGAGGKGGRGGGGLGGHSLGIAHTGEAPDLKGANITLGSPGDGGVGASMESNGGPGAAKDSQQF